MFKPVLVLALSFFLPFNGLIGFLTGSKKVGPKADSGILKKMVVSKGSVSIDLELERLNGFKSRAKSETGKVNFDIEKDSFFTVIVFDNELRGPMPSSMTLNPLDFPQLPGQLSKSYRNLVLEKAPFGEHFEFVIRDAKSGFNFFNIEGHQFEYEPSGQIFRVKGGRVLLSNDFAAVLGRSKEAGSQVGVISIEASMKVIEMTEIVDGDVKSDVLPPDPDNAGTRPGPDVVVGDVFSLGQFGSNATHVGLALGTTSCNYGTVDLNWFRLPDNDHPVIPQNLYRMSGGAGNTERFEQIGQSSVKHAFTALTQNLCGLGCNGVGGSRLGSGCSDPYGASLNSGPNLGSRAWINPYEGAYPRGDSGTSPNTHSGHSHSGVTHRILTAKDDLNTTMNSGATYWAEGQYVTPHEYQHCQSNPGECNMNNNVSYRQYNVSGTTSFSFSSAGNTVREAAAISAWTGATFSQFEPDPGNDGVGMVAYKVTETSPGVWHYEYAVYNQNIDRAIQSFSVPLGADANQSNIGFHAPPQHPGSLNDGTLGDAGFSSAPWVGVETATDMTWASETFAQNQNANAIRWGTMYNFRFDSDQAPELKDATIGFYKTGAPITVQVLGPGTGAVAGVSIQGRITTASGQGIPRTGIALIDTGGNITWSSSNQLGYYQFQNIVPGQTYDLTPSSKHYTFTPQNIDVNGNLNGINFVGTPN